MSLEFIKEIGTLVVRIDCELDHHTSDALRRKVDNEIQRRMPKHVVFDFSDVKFMDSSGIGMVMGRYKNIRRYDGETIMTNVSAQVKRIFDMSGISKMIPQFENLTKAVESIKGGRKDAV